MQCRLKNIGFVLGRFPKLAGEKRGKKVREKVMHVGKYTYVCVVNASHLSDSIKGKQKVFSSIKKLGRGTYAHFPELAAITTSPSIRTKGSCSESKRVFSFHTRGNIPFHSRYSLRLLIQGIIERRSR